MTNIFLPEKLNTCAIIITFNPEEEFQRNLTQIAEMVNEVVVVDNGSTNTDSIQLLISEVQNAILILNDENLGIATALNIGLEKVKGYGYQWAYTFDQDSRASRLLFDSHIEMVKKISEPEMISLIGVKHSDDEPENGNKVSGDSEEVKVTITSGSLMNIRSYEKIGPFRDSFFIDGVDHEYCLRSIKNGYKIFETTTPLMKHKVGNNTAHRFLFWTPMTSNHSLTRRYYMFRNNIILYKEYLFKEPKWVIQDFITTSRVAIYMLMFEKEKVKKSKVLLKSIGHGIIGKEGKLK